MVFPEGDETSGTLFFTSDSDQSLDLAQTTDGEENESVQRDRLQQLRSIHQEMMAPEFGREIAVQVAAVVDLWKQGEALAQRVRDELARQEVV